MEEVSGVIYALIDGTCDFEYIGQTIRPVEERFKQHTKADSYIGRVIRAHGEDMFVVVVLKVCHSKAELDYWERRLIKSRNTKKPNGYNITDGGGGTVGCKPTPEMRKKNSEAHIGKHLTPETCAKISEALSGENNPMFGKKHTEETKAKIRAANIIRYSTPEMRKKLSEAHIGKHPTAETLARMSAAKSGENNPFFGKHHTPETCAKISEALSGENHPNYGKTLPPETCSKLSAANRAYSPYKNLVRELDKRHLSYSALARLMGFSSHKPVSLKMCGKIRFTDRDKAKLVEIFGKPIEYLLARDDG